MDAAVLLNNFPFIILEGKLNGVGTNTALQAQLYYGLNMNNSIDNNPTFLVIFEHGLLGIYGIAVVNYYLKREYGIPTKIMVHNCNTEPNPIMYLNREYGIPEEMIV